MRRLTLFALFATLLVAGALLTGCAEDEIVQEPRILQVMTHDSFNISEEVILAFEEDYNVTVEILQAGDTGTMLNQAILARNNPPADVIYGIDNTFLSRALEADILIPYKPENVEVIPDELLLDPEYRAIPVDFGDVCLNYDRAYFEENELPVPQDLRDLTDPIYENLLVVENPAASSPGLAFLVATVGHFGEEGDYTYRDFWRELRDNEVLVVNDWSSAYYAEFSGGEFSEGNQPLVVSYATSPAAEVYFSEAGIAEPPTGAVTAPNTCFRQIEFAGIFRGRENEDVAQAFMDYVLSEPFQSDIPLHMWVFPANPNVTLPEPFASFAQVAEDPVAVPYAAIEENREAWLEAWTEIVLQ